MGLRISPVFPALRPVFRGNHACRLAFALPLDSSRVLLLAVRAARAGWPLRSLPALLLSVPSPPCSAFAAAVPPAARLGARAVAAYPVRMRTILRTLIGSQAQDLATADSDRDEASVVVAPTRLLLGLDRDEAIGTTAVTADHAAHEVERACLLGLSCNPTVLESLCGPILEADAWGEGLRALVPAFLSRPRVVEAYAGYAVSQLRMLRDRHPLGTRRGDKHARHVFRLLEQGLHLVREGEVRVRVGDREWYLERLPRLGLEDIERLAGERIEELRAAASPLPEHPDRERVSAWLVECRLAHLRSPDDPEGPGGARI